MDPKLAREKASELVSEEIAKQDEVYGPVEERHDCAGNQQFCAAMAIGDALYDRMNGDHRSFDEVPEIYPEDWDWDVFDDHGSTVANLVVMQSYIQQEIIRLLIEGEETVQ